MARWSNPSSGVGVNRFRVWPLGGDQYMHLELTANFDTVDGIVGVPAAGTAWPPSTGVDGGIYKEIQLLKAERMPIGHCFMWFRPVGTIALPAGCVVLDGSTLVPSAHDFPGVAGSVVLPNAIGRFFFGADPTKAVNAGAVAANDVNVNLPAGAPGVGAAGGENAHALTTTELAAHSHTINDPSHGHPIGATVIGGNFYPRWAFANGQLSQSLPYTWAETDPVRTGITINDAGGGVAHENRPLYVGLIPLCKVKFVTAI